MFRSEGGDPLLRICMAVLRAADSLYGTTSSVMEPRGNADMVGKVTSHSHNHTKTLESCGWCPDQLEPCVPSLYPPRSQMSHELNLVIVAQVTL